jgi:hypothetical protein
MLRDADVASIGSSVLATYFFDDTITRQITVLDFIDDFEQGIARTIPRDADGLRVQIEDIAVAEYDLAEAKKRHLDRTPQFLEDRRNFALNQALILYENENLSKQVTVSRAELEAWYRTNIRDYASPMEIVGTLLIFSDAEKARRGLSLGSKETVSVPDKMIDSWVIRRDDSPIFTGIHYALLAEMPIGRHYGPFPYEGKYAIFVKRADGPIEPRPFDQVESELRRRLVREKMNALELDYFAQNAHSVQVHLNLADYGLKEIAP